MMIKTDVSILYKTKLCKKFSANGYCPYGMRCQFIHDFAEPATAQQKPKVEVKVLDQESAVASRAPLNINSKTFMVSKDTKQAPVAVSMVKLGQGAVQAASGTGGFGNKQTASAVEFQKVVYKDILIHNLHVSIQEFQKKSKMYQKKVTKKRQEMICPPEMQYMNIYKQSAKRLGVFDEITDQYDQQAQGEFLPQEYSFFGDATAYEKYLDH